MAGKWKVEFDRENCIGAGACVATNAEWWSIDQDGKATLKAASYDPDRKIWTLEIEESEVQKQMDAAGVCPVTVIHIIDPNGEKKI
jgi:ferredoxin